MQKKNVTTERKNSKTFRSLVLGMSLLISGAVVMQATAQTDTARFSSHTTISPPAGDLGGFRAPMAYAPNAAISYNAIFGGSGDDYVNTNGVSLNNRDIKIASDGTLWMCGSTASTDGDFSGNHGGVDAWLLNIDPATNQIKYNRCFGGTGFDEFCSLALMNDGTVWVAGNTNSSDGDLAGVIVKNNLDGWVMHIDPSQLTLASQITYNRCIGGTSDDYFYNIAIAPDNNAIWLCGETFSSNGDNTGANNHGGGSTDAWLVGIDPNQNASAALKYNQCFGGSRGEAFLACKPMSDGTVWLSGTTKSTDGNIAAALTVNHGVAGTQDAWLVNIKPSAAVGSQLIYNRCFGGASHELFDSICVLADNTIWLKGCAGSTDGDLIAANHHGTAGTYDVWLIHVNPTAAFSPTDQQIIYNRCFGGSANDGSDNIGSGISNFVIAADGTIWVTAQTESNDGDLATAGSHGGVDTWIFNLDPATNQFNYNKCWGGTGDEICPAIALDETKKQVWVSCGTKSNNDGDVPATKGGRDAWLFSINYGTTGIESITNDELRIYPNPVKDYLRFTNYELRFNKVEILDLSGKTLMSQSSLSSPINVTTLPSGVYFVKITTDSGIITKKFIKE